MARLSRSARASAHAQNRPEKRLPVTFDLCNNMHRSIASGCADTCPDSPVAALEAAYNRAGIKVDLHVGALCSGFVIPRLSVMTAGIASATKI